MTKNLEIDLTPQNEEWINLIPSKSKNLDLIINKLVELSIHEGLLLEVISQTLTLPDLKKFRTSYGKLQSTRNSFLDDLDVTPTQIERKKVTQTMVTDIEQEQVKPKKTEKKSSGWSEDSF